MSFPRHLKPVFFVCIAAVCALLLPPPPLAAQSGRPLIDVEFYDIRADINMNEGELEASANVRFIPREETGEAVFELHNALNVLRVVDGNGEEIPKVRYQRNYTVRLQFPAPLPPGEPVSVTFYYGGRLQGDVDSPYEGVSLASIEPQRAYLLYPARWFPVNGYGADRFAAHITVTAPQGTTVIGSGLSSEAPLEKNEVGVTRRRFEYDQPSFPGSIAVVRGEPARVESEGVPVEAYFKEAPPTLEEAYAGAAGPMVNYYTQAFGQPYSRSLTLVEVGERAPNAYAAPGIIFLAPWAIGNQVNQRLLATQVAHQWWRVMVSPGNRNHVWLDKGLALYSAVLFIEETQGEAPAQAEIDDIRIHALTYDEIPIRQSSRLPDFSTELDALAGSKGAMVLHMLRWVVGDDAFRQSLRAFYEKYAGDSATTDFFREVVEQVSGERLGPFFIQWTENRGTPEFSQEYTIYRLGGGKGFRVIGKVKQDLDTFSMPLELKIETEGEPEYKVIDVQGGSSDYSLDTFGKPKRVVLDPNNRILRFDDKVRTQVVIRKGEQLAELGYYREALNEYQKALEINRYSSLAHYRVGEVFFLQNNYQSAANEFREALNGNRIPEWTEVWSHINLGKIFDITGQRERAVNEYQLAIRTRDNTQGAQEVAQQYLKEPYRRPRQRERIY